ncbi:hypothetical protein KLP28_11560 [Nocardioidaceae bacterium]|nr:hypothetical protein KLP28_11560 [Nocardioidaceae bacterium]
MSGPAYDSAPPGGGERARPLTLVVIGFLVVIADLRADGFDLLPDPIGWVLVVIGLAPLRGRHPGFSVAYGTAIALVPLSLLLLSSVDLLDGAAARAASLLDTLTTVAVEAGVLLGVAALTARERTRRIALVALAGAALAAVIGAASALFAPVEQTTVSGGSAALLVVVVVAVLVLLLAALLWLYRVGAEPEFRR